MEYILAFKNTHLAIKAERSLADRKIPAGVMPLPPAIKAGCGICLRVALPEIGQAIEALAADGVADMTLYTRDGGVYTEYRKERND